MAKIIKKHEGGEIEKAEEEHQSMIGDYDNEQL